MAESTCEMIDEQPISGGNSLPDLAWVETLFASLDAKHSANDELAAIGDSEPDQPAEALIDTVVADEVPAQIPSDVRRAAGDVESEVMSSATPVALPAQCLLRDAVETKTAMLEHVGDEVMHIDIGAVERVDAAFMQVLVALIKQRQSNGKALPAWSGVSAALREAAQLLGLTELMRLPTA